MKILQINNEHRHGGGSDVAARSTTKLLQKKGHQVNFTIHDSNKLGQGLRGKIRAFFSGIYSVSARKEISRLIQKFEPDIVHVHELYPFFSPWILVDCKSAGIPVVMTCHDYRLTCPTAFHFKNGAICEKCLGGKEYWCVLKNCQGNFFESVAYWLRSLSARSLRLFHKNISVFITLSEFAKSRLMAAGFNGKRIEILPNMAPKVNSPSIPSNGGYIASVGRLSPEKGIDILLQAAAHLPQIPFQIAGDGPFAEQLAEQAPSNAILLGRLSSEKMQLFYQNARFLVVSSRCFEGYPLVIAEAMMHGLPVITSRLGGMDEIVEDGITGFCIEPENPEVLAERIRQLWNDPRLCEQMGQAGRKKALAENSPEIYYRRLLEIYEKAIQCPVK